MTRLTANSRTATGHLAAIAALCAISLSGGLAAFAGDAETCADPQLKDVARLPVPSVVQEALFSELIGWIALNTSYDLRLEYRSPPTLSFCYVGETVLYEDAELLVERILKAAFDLPNRHIYLVHPWSPVNLFDQSVLLHELIHDVQHYNRDWDCRGAPELEAYFLQDRWLVERGVHYPFDWGAIRLLSTCETDGSWQ